MFPCLDCVKATHLQAKMNSSCTSGTVMHVWIPRHHCTKIKSGLSLFLSNSSSVTFPFVHFTTSKRVSSIKGKSAIHQRSPFPLGSHHQRQNFGIVLRALAFGPRAEGRPGRWGRWQRAGSGRASCSGSWPAEPGQGRENDQNSKGSFPKSRNPNSRKPPKLLRKTAGFQKRTMGEKNGESTPRRFVGFRS